MKPRLCRFSWRAFASTHLHLLGRLFLLASFTSLKSAFTVESTLYSPCSRSDLPLSCQGAALAHLDSLSPRNLILWTDGSVPFPFGKGGFGYLPTALSVALRPLFSFQQAQYVQVFLLKPALFCKVFAGLGSTNKSATSPLLSDSRSVPVTLSSSPSFFLPQTLWQELSFVSSCSIRLQWVSGHLFLQGTTRLMSWPYGERYLRPLQSLVVSFLLSLVSTLVLSRTGGVLSDLNSSTHRFPQFPPRNLCSLVTLAVFSLIYAPTDTAFC